MGHGKNYSSESDEDTNVRHDRFKSERFKDTNKISSKSAYDSIKPRECSSSHGRHTRNNYRDHRSPSRSPKASNELSLKKMTRKKIGAITEPRSNKYERCDLRHHLSSQSQKKHSDKHENYREVDDCQPSNKNSKKLSSILMNFDKKNESKRSSFETLPQIGPVLPPHLTENVNDLTKPFINCTKSIDPTLPSRIEHTTNDSSEEPNDHDASNQFKKVKDFETKMSRSSGDKDQSVVNDTLCSMGPALPPHLQSNVSDECDQILSNNSDKNTITKSQLNEYSPVLPPKFEEDSYGPALPPNFKTPVVNGPKLPTGMTADDLERVVESEDEDTFGPLPIGKMNMTQYQLEIRAMDIKRKLEEEKRGSSKDITKREEWMLELPPEKASNLGLGPRSFRMREGPDMSNRSAWTETPAQKKLKEEMALRGETEPTSSEETIKTAFVKERNETMEKISKLSRNKDREKSLLEMHQKKLKKKKKKEEKEGKKKERRPFDRNIDLQVHRFDEAQKKAIFKKAQLLDTRFSRGESKFL